MNKKKLFINKYIPTYEKIQTNMLLLIPQTLKDQQQAKAFIEKCNCNMAKIAKNESFEEK